MHGKKLENMTLQELWELFPIELTPHNHEWVTWARQEIDFLSGLLEKYNPVISHIGSTVIPGIQAKPIIDILVEISGSSDWHGVISIMKCNGYILMNRSPQRMSFNKGYTPEGYAERVFHIHFHESGDNDEILFRDYLKSHPEVAKEYESLKLSLLPAFRNNRDGYTEAKTQFVKDIVSRAKLSGD